MALLVVTAGWLLAPGTARAGADDPGYDVSWPQCGRFLPAEPSFAVVGVSGGRPYLDNPCLADQYRWARSGALPPAFYMNTSNPGPASEAVDWYAQRRPDPACSPANEAACAYDHGHSAAAHAFAYAEARTGAASRHPWWLDVETLNSWSRTDLAANVAAIRGAVDHLRGRGVTVGVYSTAYQWGVITGGAAMPDLSTWLAGARDLAAAQAMCGAGSFNGGRVLMVQYVEGDLDRNHLCVRPEVTPPPPQSGLDIGRLLSALLDLLPGR